MLSKSVSIICDSSRDDTVQILTDEDPQGGFVDEDETRGPERDAAVSSPTKGKVHATNQVCYLFVPL